MLTEDQLRAGRALVRWSAKELAGNAGLSLPTIQRMEANGPAKSSLENVEKVKRALEAAGVIFIDDGAASSEGGPGVRLK